MEVLFESLRIRRSDGGDGRLSVVVKGVPEDIIRRLSRGLIKGRNRVR